MKSIQFDDARIENGMLCLHPANSAEMQKARGFCYEMKGLYDAEIKKHHEKRSLNANALFWKGVGLIAEATRVDNMKVYKDLLRAYGSYTHIIVKPHVVEQFKRIYRLCENVGEIEINSKKGVQLLCYLGSSTYDKKQMSRLIDGMMQEIKALEIDFLPESDISKSLEEWQSNESVAQRD